MLRWATMSASEPDCFSVAPNTHGERATYAKASFSAGEVVYVIQGPTCSRTIHTIQIGEGAHVFDAYAQFINHSFTPNIAVRGREMVALVAIAIADEITFNYLESESAILSPFTCHETGAPIRTELCVANT